MPEEVEMQLSVAALVSDLNPSQVSLFAKWIRKIRETNAKRRVLHDVMSLTKTPENVKQCRIICKGSKLSIMNNIPRHSSKVNCAMMSVKADNHVKFYLKMVDSVDIL